MTNPFPLAHPVDIEVAVPVVHAGGYGTCPGSVFTTTTVCIFGGGPGVCSGFGRDGDYDGSDAETVCVSGFYIAFASVVGSSSVGTGEFSELVEIDCYALGPIDWW
ncbi:MAG: hypothetical protein ACR2H3_02365 [Acidimicrobiales bacterium]